MSDLRLLTRYFPKLSIKGGAWPWCETGKRGPGWQTNRLHGAPSRPGTPSGARPLRSCSAIKRDQGVKAYGTLIGGHGGVMDRVDSICFAAPAFFHLTRYFFT
ncbi:MAG: phosphatidate cytidylyltransferase [Victivallales bacterium]|nr:phosphatidate cytidylyltransferase [Victivallales bacterium]